MTDFRLELTGLEQLSTAALEAQSPDAAANLADFAKANALLDQGKPDQAAALCQRLLAERRVNVITATNAALLFREAGRADLAQACQTALVARLQARAALHPDDMTLQINIGWILIALKAYDLATAHMADVVQRDPLNEPVATILATIRMKLGDPNGAIAAWAGVFAAKPRDGRISLNLARRLAAQGFAAQARQMLDLAEPLSQDNRHEFQFIADGIRGTETAKEQAAMTVEIFDGFSKSYDKTLQSLGNRGPDIVGLVLAQLGFAKKRTLMVLDAGCGTGLCAPYLRPLAKVLHGCDLSEGMLTEAKRKGRYDLLTRSDLSSIGTLPAGPFDLIVTSDVLVYFGDLAEVFANFAKITRPGGWLIITVEDAGDPGPARGWELGVSGRHRHSLAYLQRALAKAGFAAPRHLISDTLRHESGKPVPGLGFATQRLSLML